MAIGGPGVPLPYPAAAFPVTTGVSGKVGSNKFFLPRATVWTIPPGRFAIFTGTHSYVQILDPVTQTWITVTPGGAYVEVNSDGTNTRLANLSGTPAAQGTVTAAGSGYVQASTTVTSTGLDTWRGIVDGNVASVTVGTDKNGVAGGTNFTNVPLLVVDAPPPGGRQATVSATITSGAITGVTVQDGGAGYLGVPNVAIVPNPTDPTAGAITFPTLTAVLATPTGAITGVFLTYQGLSVASAPTLTVRGVGTGATATAALVGAAADDTVTVQPLPSAL